MTSLAVENQEGLVLVIGHALLQGHTQNYPAEFMETSSKFHHGALTIIIAYRFLQELH